MNRYQLELQLSGVRDSLQSANEKLVAMYSDVTSKMEEREAQANTEREEAALFMDDLLSPL